MAAKKPTSRKTGRPTKYSKNYAPLAAEVMARVGMIDEEIAARFGVNRSTIHEWKKKHPEFAEALERGKAEPNSKVEAALFRRALGYEYVEITETDSDKNGSTVERKQRHMAPDTGAIIFFLKNRMPERWRNNMELAIDFENDPMSKLADAIRGFRTTDEPPPE